MEQNTKKGIAFAVLAAALYAINAPFSKLLLEFVPPTLMAGFLYIGAGVGMMVIAFIKKVRKSEAKEQPLTKSELPYTIAMILLDIAAPIFLLLGLNATTAANVSLLNNFEIVATAIIALMVFKEHISARLWLGILFVTLSCGILSFEDVSSLRFSYGSLFVLLAAVCWGFENNCTRKISSRDPLQIVLLKGIFSGIGSVIIGLSIGERTTFWGEHYVGHASWVRRLWTEHLFLRLCTAFIGCRTNKCILCGCTIYSSNIIAYSIQRVSRHHLFHGARSDDRWRLAIFTR